MQGVCAATASAAQMQGRFGMGPWARGWVAGTGRGAFLWLGLSIILSLVLLGLGSNFSKCIVFLLQVHALRQEQLREEGEGGDAVGGVSRQLELT